MAKICGSLEDAQNGLVLSKYKPEITALTLTRNTCGNLYILRRVRKNAIHSSIMITFLIVFQSFLNSLLQSYSISCIFVIYENNVTSYMVKKTSVPIKQKIVEDSRSEGI